MSKEQMPINKVEWLKASELKANDYNPNHVAPIELKLLKISLIEDGWTQPVVIRENNEIVDGFHRWMLCKEDKQVSTLTEGMVPVVKLTNKDISNQMMSTIRHNRARGVHGVMLMSDIVQKLKDENKVPDKVIQEKLGMEEEEVERLHDQSGMTKRGSKKTFNTGWRPKR